MNYKIIIQELPQKSALKTTNRALPPVKEALHLENQSLEEQVQKAQKFEAIGLLAGGIAHDFNNLLTPIIGYIEMTLNSRLVKRLRVIRENLETVLSAAYRAKDLVNQILAISRGHEQEPTVIAVSPIVKETTKLFKSTLPPNITINESINVKDDHILADPTRIHQVLLNLCTNAMHAMEETGGALTIGLKKKHLDKNFTDSYHNLNPGDHLELTIADTGHGISEEIIAKIFTPLFTTKEKGKGTGLGLSTCHDIIQKYKGDIMVKSKVGKGTVFTIYLPCAEKKTADVKPVRITSALPGGTERIMVIEDDEDILSLIEEQLAPLGYQVHAYNQSADAILELNNNPYNYDIVITDMVMRGLGGLKIAKFTKKKNPGIKVILITGNPDVLNIDYTEINRVVTKPYKFQDFASLIREVLDQKN
ncbi:ATP-binding protein [Candidatus Margulisiibacteriota bacterium]